MKAFVISILLFGYALAGVAQNESNQFFLRNYKQTLSLKLDASNSYIVTDEYGKLISSHDNQLGNNYLFQGQEYDRLLDILFFPKRMYNSNTQSFFQPDPVSQYVSPYVYVNKDPVNHTDFDGNEGRPLVLFQEDHSAISNTNASMKDIMADVPNAHYVPLSDFINGNIGDLNEWNGNVFIKGHMDIRDGVELWVETAPNSKMIKTKPSMVKPNQAPDGLYEVNIDAERLGGMLRRFSEERGVPINNITAGGCEGEFAAKRIGRGYVEGGSKFNGRRLNTYGLKEDFEAMPVGKFATEGEYYKELEATRYHAIHYNHRDMPYVEGEFPYARLKHFDSARVIGEDAAGNEKLGIREPLPYAEGAELDGLVNSRIPKQLEPFFTKHEFIY